MNESQGRDLELESHSDEEMGGNGRRYRSPNRVLARSFRISRDGWKSKDQVVQVKLEQQRQLAAERGRSREQWKLKCEAATTRAEEAEILARQRLEELEQARAELAKLQAKKTSRKQMRSPQSVAQHRSV